MGRSFSTSKWVRAKKTHYCSIYGCYILSNTPYIRTTGRHDNYFDTEKVCVNCAAQNPQLCVARKVKTVAEGLIDDRRRSSNRKIPG